MKIDSKLLERFVTKATLNATLTSMAIKVSSTGLFAQQKDLSNAGMTSVTLDASKIKELWSTEETICIKNTSMLIKSLASFSGDVEIIKNTNILSLVNADRQVDIVLSSEEFIECNLPAMPESLATAFDKGVDTNILPFKKIVSDMAIVNGKYILVEIKDKKLELITGEKGFDTISNKSPLDYTDCKAKYGEILSNAINVIDDKINIAMKTDFPIQIKESVDGISCKYIIAPLVENE